MWHTKPPDVIGCYLVFTNDCYVCMAFFNSDKKWCEMWSQQFLEVKYWIPLPEAPSEKNIDKDDEIDFLNDLLGCEDNDFCSMCRIDVEIRRFTDR